jgi:hypothetical protein
MFHPSGEKVLWGEDEEDGGCIGTKGWKFRRLMN